MTPFGLIQITTLVQGTIYLVAQFVRIVFKILEPYSRKRAKPFLNDIGVKGLQITYNNEKLAPKI